MAGRIILDVCNPALDSSGNVDANAILTFYENGTTTLQSIYSDSTLGTALPNPLSCDAAGRFPVVWANTDLIYSVAWAPTGATPITFDNIIPIGGQSVNITILDTTTALLAQFGSGVVVTDGTSFSTAGRTAVGDGGGGTFYYKASDTTTADNGGTIRVDSQGRRWYYTNPSFIDILMFGGDNTGATASDTANSNALAAAATYSASTGSPTDVHVPGGKYTFNAQINVDSSNNIGFQFVGAPVLQYIGSTISSDTPAGAFIYFSGGNSSFGGFKGRALIDANKKAAFCVGLFGTVNEDFDMGGVHFKNALLDCILVRSIGTAGAVQCVIRNFTAYPASANFNGSGKIAVCGRYVVNIDQNVNSGTVVVRDFNMDNGVSGFIGVQGQTTYAGWDTVIRDGRFEMNDDGIDCVQVKYAGAVSSAGAVKMRDVRFVDATGGGVTNCNLIHNISAINVRPHYEIDPVSLNNALQYIYKDDNNSAFSRTYNAKYLDRRVTGNFTSGTGQFVGDTALPSGALAGDYCLDTTNHLLLFQDVSLVAQRIEFGGRIPSGPGASPVASALTDSNLLMHNNNLANFTYNLPASGSTQTGWRTPVFWTISAGIITIAPNGTDKIDTKAASATLVSSNAAGNVIQLEYSGVAATWRVVTTKGTWT